MFFKVPTPKNEPVKTYAPGTKERDLLKAKLDELDRQTMEIPAIIDGKEVFSGNTANCIEPHNHQHVIAKYHKCGETEVNLAIQAAMKAKKRLGANVFLPSRGHLPQGCRIAVHKILCFVECRHYDGAKQKCLSSRN